MAPIVFALCALTSLTCAFLLSRAYSRSRVRFLLWSSLGFIGFALNNILILVDLYLLPGMDLSVLRLIPALGGAAILVFGLIWDTA